MIAAGAYSAENDVLIVDDEPSIVSTLADLFTSEGYSVRLATNALEAITAIAYRPPAVMLLDFNMPILSGGDVIRRLQSAGHAFPIAIVTAWPALAVPFLSRQITCIEKPFDNDVLLAWVGQYVYRAHAV